MAMLYVQKFYLQLAQPNLFVQYRFDKKKIIRYSDG